MRPLFIDFNSTTKRPYKLERPIKEEDRARFLTGVDQKELVKKWDALEVGIVTQSLDVFREKEDKKIITIASKALDGVN